MFVWDKCFRANVEKLDEIVIHSWLPIPENEHNEQFRNLTVLLCSVRVSLKLTFHNLQNIDFYFNNNQTIYMQDVGENCINLQRFTVRGNVSAPVLDFTNLQAQLK